MKLNNKGITLTEIIISIALISIVLIFLFSLLITVNDINEESEVNSTYLINKSLIIKNIESDLKDEASVNISSCEIDSIYSSYGPVGDTNYFKDDVGYNKKYEANECIKINNSYIGIYYYDKQSSYVISYINKDNDIKVTKLLEKFEENNVNDGNLKKEFIKKTDECDGSNNCFATIIIPIIGPDGKDYSIIIPYYGKVLVKQGI